MGFYGVDSVDRNMHPQNDEDFRNDDIWLWDLNILASEAADADP